MKSDDLNVGMILHARSVHPLKATITDIKHDWTGPRIRRIFTIEVEGENQPRTMPFSVLKMLWKPIIH